MIKTKGDISAFSFGDINFPSKAQNEEREAMNLRMQHIRHNSEQRTRIYTAMLLFGIYGTLSYI